MRLEDDQIEALRRWGQALRDAGDEEHAPAGRAILMLLEEVERLRLELAADTGDALASTLRGRLQQAARHESSSLPEDRQESAEGTGSGPRVDRATSSPEAWIEALRQRE